MKNSHTTLKLSLIAGAFVLQMSPPSIEAQTDDDRTAFRRWATQSLHPVIDGSINASTADLRPLRKMIGDARIVALSEGVHAGAEPLAFRNRLFRYLVEDLGFDAIAIESGIVESRVIHDYVSGGQGELDTAVKQGLSWTFDTYPQNRELIHWMRNYNAQLPPGARQLQFFGFDVPGSPGNTSAARGPETALDVALGYLRTVDPRESARIQSRVSTFVTRGMNGYAGLSAAERDALTAAIADLISLMEHRRFDYIGKSSKADYEWGERAATGARQMDAWLRRMPVGWAEADRYEWRRDAAQIRERAMADNLEWIVDRIGPRGRVLVFASVSHTASMPLLFPDAPERNMWPFGAYAKARFGADFINIFNVLVDGKIADCSARERRPIALEPPPIPSAEALFASVNVPRYILDLRSAPPRVSLWLRQTHDHWNGFGTMSFPTAAAFDIAFYVSPITPACASK